MSKININDLKLANWTLDDQGRVITDREPAAEFWRPGENGSIACELCYRNCEIAPGEAGWCKIRTNEAGQMTLPSHGVISMAVKMQRGYSYDAFHTYKPGALSAFFGGTHCTAACSFCTSGIVTFNPDKMPWGAGERKSGIDFGWAYARCMLHPVGAISLAGSWGASQITLAGNEPTLTYEWTLDVSRLARRAGLDVCIETNGYSPPDVIHALAPFTDAVTVGVKGSANERFYEKYLRSPGAVPHVLAAIQEWNRAGVHLMIGDVVAPPHMETDEEFEESAKRLYGWIAEKVGELTPTILMIMTTPAPLAPNLGLVIPKGASRESAYTRIGRALELAKQAGLKYAFTDSHNATIKCHACNKPLLIFRSPMMRCGPCTQMFFYCDLWSHEQFVTDSRCDHCGTEVPIKTLSKKELSKVRKIVKKLNIDNPARRVPIRLASTVVETSSDGRTVVIKKRL